MAMSARRIVAVDVGNTLTRMGMFVDESLVFVWEIATPAALTPDEARLALAGFETMLCRDAAEMQGTRRGKDGNGEIAEANFADDAVLSCVVPDLTQAWAQALRAECGKRPLVVGPGVKTGVKMNYNDPSEVGPDRVADLVAAREQYASPLIIIDLGTTTNFEIVGCSGAFEGGIIAPGLSLSAKALAQAAARLPVIEVKAPRSLVGKSTREAMQAGVVMGEVARIDGLIDMVWNELGCSGEVVLTGTDAQALCALIAHDARVDDTLTLRGLALIHRANRS